MANVSSEVVFGMFFLTLSGVNIDFLGRELRWRTYTTKKARPTNKHVELVDKKEFATAVLDLESEIFVVYVASISSITLLSFSLLELHVYLFRKPQVFGLIIKEAPIKIFTKYSDFADIFSPDLASKLSKHTGINDYAIKLIDNQQPPYGPIYSLKSVELKIIKAYIEINLANEFIKPSKSPANTSILFDQKSNGFLQLCVNY